MKRYTRFFGQPRGTIFPSAVKAYPGAPAPTDRHRRNEPDKKHADDRREIADNPGRKDYSLCKQIGNKHYRDDDLAKRDLRILHGIGRDGHAASLVIEDSYKRDHEQNCKNDLESTPVS
jgi:6-phosphogluconolactonase/glucosamine-6-phosphate isomerase/deaminase